MGNPADFSSGGEVLADTIADGALSMRVESTAVA
jgi:hypothetical protein